MQTSESVNHFSAQLISSRKRNQKVICPLQLDHKLYSLTTGDACSSVWSNLSGLTTFNRPWKNCHFLYWELRRPGNVILLVGSCGGGGGQTCLVNNTRFIFILHPKLVQRFRHVIKPAVQKINFRFLVIVVVDTIISGRSPPECVISIVGSHLLHSVVPNLPSQSWTFFWQGTWQSWSLTKVPINK